jgi:hypothetical protein
MKAITFVMTAALVAASGLVAAAEMAPDAAREQRMNDALDRYHDSRNAQPGPAARSEESIKRGAHKTGEAIEHGARKVGHAIGTGVHKTGEAIHNAGEKLEDKTAPK